MTQLALVLIALLVAIGPAQSCDNDVCQKCGAASEYSWNPANENTSQRLRRFYDLNDLVESAFLKGDYKRAEQLIQEYLGLAHIYRCNWNFGNAVHDANRFLGLIALSRGDVRAAEVYLINAGHSPGSPQLNSFGPELDLATALLKRGSKEAVITYLESVAKFWKFDGNQTNSWIRSIKAGETPALIKSDGDPSPLQIFLSWTIFLWPFVVGTVSLVLAWGTVPRRFILAALTVGLGYISMYLANSALIALISRISPGWDFNPVVVWQSTLLLTPALVAVVLFRRFKG